jgi:CheY-like chemotaxis protein
MVLRLPGLVKRGDVWIYRRIVPPKLRSIVGASEIKRTLGTDASTALDALAVAPEADIIITDFALPPGEDGVWLLEQVNGQPRPIPVVLVSGFHEHQVARLAAAPFARKLLKPIEPERLCEEIAEVLRGPAA